MSRDVVRNAADPEQVARGRRKTEDRARRLRRAWRAVMSTPDGRVVFWDLLDRAGVYRSVWRASAEIHYLAGRQDFGHEIQAQLLAVNEDLYDLMAKEARAYARAQERENAAAQTARVSAEEPT